LLELPLLLGLLLGLLLDPLPLELLEPLPVPPELGLEPELLGALVFVLVTELPDEPLRLPYPLLPCEPLPEDPEDPVVPVSLELSLQPTNIAAIAKNNNDFFIFSITPWFTGCLG
jgi:hypothetical protein